jgi:hypothetical protein
MFILYITCRYSHYILIFFLAHMNQSEKRIACGGHVCKQIGMKWAILIKDLPPMLPTKFRFIWRSDFEGEDWSIGPTIKIILSVQDNFCRTFATVRRTFGMTVSVISQFLIHSCWPTNFNLLHSVYISSNSHFIWCIYWFVTCWNLKKKHYK